MACRTWAPAAPPVTRPAFAQPGVADARTEAPEAFCVGIAGDGALAAVEARQLAAEPK
jgi:hypothetical protein